MNLKLNAKYYYLFFVAIIIRDYVKMDSLLTYRNTYVRHFSSSIPSIDDFQVDSALNGQSYRMSIELQLSIVRANKAVIM